MGPHVVATVYYIGFMKYQYVCFAVLHHFIEWSIESCVLVRAKVPQNGKR